MLNFILSDAKSRVLGFTLSMNKTFTSGEKLKASPTKTGRLHKTTKDDNPATILVDGSNFHGITSMESHPNRYICWNN